MSRPGPAAKRPSGREGPCPVGIAPPMSREKQRQRKKTSFRAPRPKGRFARRVPLKSNESRCSPLWRALRAIARQSGYPRFARLAFGRGARRLGCRLAFQTPLQFRFPRAEGRVREQSPKSAELCVAPPLLWEQMSMANRIAI